MGTNRSPLALKPDDADLVELTRALQERLGCVVNEEVFLECPYAFVTRRVALEISQEADSPLEHLSGKIVAWEEPEMLLVGYADDKILPDGQFANFVICLTEESTSALIQRNRDLTKCILTLVENEIRKAPKPWSDQGSATVLEDFFLRPGRMPLEVDLSLKVSELMRPRVLTDRSTNDDVRNGYVELLSINETFQNIEFKNIDKACQTNLEMRENGAQTYPEHPKNQWTQYEFEIPEEFKVIWEEEKKEEEEKSHDDQEENDKENGNEITADNPEEEVEKTPEEIMLEEKKKAEWEKLTNFIKSQIVEMIDVVTFNTFTNFYTNDVASLDDGQKVLVFLEPWKDYEELVNLIDLDTVRSRYLISASWHCESETVLACSYLSVDTESTSLVVLWSLENPLRPKVTVKCEDRVSVISFCPLKNYTNIIVAGCLTGKIIIWEVNEDMLEDEEDAEQLKKLPATIKEATIATSSEKAQTMTITNIQWLPLWCRIETDGSFHRVSSSKEFKACFATCSIDGSIFFWSLPKSLSTPATVRSPLHLNVNPVYQLILEEKSVVCFNLPLAKNEESSNERDLDRLRRVFLGTNEGEVLCCTWDSESSQITSRYCAHDDMIRAMVKSPYLDDVFLSVGGRVFAIWKEDLPDEPIFRRRGNSWYGDGCWSSRPGVIALMRLDGCLELWDLKRRSDEPVLLQTISHKVTPYIWPSSPLGANKYLAISDGPSSLRVFIEPQPEDNREREEDLERIEWFEEFSWRETKRKREFKRWQEEFLAKDPRALRRKAEREQAEVHRRHQEAREKFLRDQELLAQAEAERKLRERRVSKTVLWRQNELKRAQTIMLKKKGFVPEELEEKRKPLVELEEQRQSREQKIREELAQANVILDKFLSTEIPGFQSKEEVEDSVRDPEMEEKLNLDHQAEIEKLRVELMREVKEHPYEPKFNWSEAMERAAKRMEDFAPSEF